MRLVWIIPFLVFWSSNGGAVLKESEFKKLGFNKTTFFDSDQSKITVITDDKTGWKAKIIYPFLKNLVSYHRNRVVEIYDEKNKLVEKTESDVLTFVRETHWPKSEKFEIRWLKVGQYLKTDYLWDPTQLVWKFASSSIVSQEIFESSCEVIPISFEELDKIVALTEPVMSMSTESREEDYFSGTSIRTDGCEAYGKEGIKELAEDFEAAIDQGARCLSGLGNWKTTSPILRSYLEKQKKPELVNQLRMIAAQMMGLLDPMSERPFTIICDKLNEKKAETDRGIFSESRNGVYATTFICGRDPKWPGMGLHLYNMNKTNRLERSATLFHEMIHSFGLLHDLSHKTFDAVYAMEFCCFGIPKNDSLKNDSSKPKLEDIKISESACSDLMSTPHGGIKPKL